MRIFIWLASLGFLGAIAAGLLFIAAFTYFSRDLPDYAGLKDYEPPILTRLHAADGQVLGEIAAERRVFVPYVAIPDLVKQAFLAAEDKDFFKHKGVDMTSILRAIIGNLQQIGSGRRPVGASTITQQVARNFFLTNEVSYERKIREMILAFRLETALSKERILELYLNQIFLGERSYGVAAAAQNYFGKSLDELNVAEAAYLAALPKAPNNYHPIDDHAAAMARRNWVINRMLEDGHVTRAQADAAMASPLKMTPRTAGGGFASAYFAEEVRRELVALYGEPAVLQGGLYVRTSVDPKLQDLATRVLQQGLEEYDLRRGYRGPVARNVDFTRWPESLQAIAKPAGAEAWELAAVTAITNKVVEVILPSQKGVVDRSEIKWAERGGELTLRRGDVVLVERAKDSKNSFYLRQVPRVQGALVALDPHTGRVLAMVGGFSPKISVFNRATQAQRQPGSAFKPFVYLTALDNGFTPASLVLDAPFTYFQGPGLPLWRPENYSEEFYGPTPLRVGMEKSRNVMTVRLANYVGMEKIAATAEKFGLVEKMPLLLSMSLGAIETTPLKLTAAYGMMVNGGRKIEPTFIDMVQNRQGQVVYRRAGDDACVACVNVTWQPNMAVPEMPDTRPQIQDPRTAYQMVSILEGVVQRGTAGRLAGELKFPVAGKTGTTNDARDAWFVGFTPDLAVGVYVGFDEPQSLGNRETGGSVAVPIFGEFMQGAMAGKPPIPFRVPPGLRMVRIDPKTGDEVQEGGIWEGFIPGTEPSAAARVVLDGSADTASGAVGESADLMGMPEVDGGAVIIEGVGGGVPLVPQPAPPPAVPQGTGGLY